ncbi:hypothetical protein MSSAC_3096 [Methanosarcina siciliae C2J]|uniref:Uncharacterized protein n=1 Tax=Methanosarcina siciliae C2J TaxID=1434118 RepID=A0A0E3LDQ6_9EURY|nr:hypothetical protein [Methanosarcina siciliae]AKB37686.1 hypothetical protein MSSAC_3096 [Methanosarcina siciliae C2J]
MDEYLVSRKDLEKRLRLTRHEMEVAQKLESKLAVARRQLKTAQTDSKKLTKELTKEKNDVENLEKLSITRIIAEIKGTKDKKIKKERQEYWAAQLKYEASEKVIEELEKEINSLLGQRKKSFYDIESEYGQLLQEKEEVLKGQPGETSQKLLYIAEEKGRLAAEEKELMEAEHAAQNAISSLNQLMETLKSADNWGKVDILGGGLITTAIKHSRIGDAREQIAAVQKNLNSLQRELGDIKKIDPDEVKINIGGLATFADYAFDGLVVDLIVQSRINEAQNRSQDLHGQVESICCTVYEWRKNVKREMKELDKDKQSLIEKSTIDEHQPER